jgi:hypothetical protein
LKEEIIYIILFYKIQPLGATKIKIKITPPSAENNPEKLQILKC